MWVQTNKGTLVCQYMYTNTGTLVYVYRLIKVLCYVNTD